MLSMFMTDSLVLKLLSYSLDFNLIILKSFKPYSLGIVMLVWL